MTDPIADILGDYQAFFAGQKEQLRKRERTVTIDSPDE